MRQRCEHALSTPRPFGSWEHLPCGGALLTPLGQITVLGMRRHSSGNGIS